MSAGTRHRLARLGKSQRRRGRLGLIFPSLVQVLSDHLGYAITAITAGTDFSNSLVAFDPTTHSVTKTILSAGSFLSDIELNDRDELFLADRNITKPGVRIFRASDGGKLTQSPLDLGLPPFDILFLK